MKMVRSRQKAQAVFAHELWRSLDAFSVISNSVTMGSPLFWLKRMVRSCLFKDVQSSKSHFSDDIPSMNKTKKTILLKKNTDESNFAVIEDSLFLWGCEIAKRNTFYRHRWNMVESFFEVLNRILLDSLVIWQNYIQHVSLLNSCLMGPKILDLLISDLFWWVKKYFLSAKQMIFIMPLFHSGYPFRCPSFVQNGWSTCLFYVHFISTFYSYLHWFCNLFLSMFCFLNNLSYYSTV